MTFQEAEEKLKAIAAGRFFSLGYNKMTHSDGTTKTECTLYIDGEHIQDIASTWDDVFRARELRVNNITQDAPEEGKDGK